LEYFADFLSAAISAAAPADRAVWSTYDAANELATVTSQVSGFPFFHGMSVRPSGRFPSVLERPLGSFAAGIPAEANARAKMSFKA
jgi:hypothetical protein